MDKREIQEIYKNKVQELDSDDRISLETKKEILHYLEADRNTLGEKEFESYKDKAFHLATIGEEGGFIRGFKCGFRLCMECLDEI